MTLTVFSLALAAGCALDAEPGDELLDTELDTELDSGADSEETTAAAFCAPLIVAPAPDWTHNFATDPDVARFILNYGTTSCSSYVVQLDNGGNPYYEQGKIVVTPSSTPTTVDACVGTSITVRRWLPPTSTTGWTSTTETAYGEWTATGCNPPRITKYSYWTPGVRFQISAKKFTCPGGGPLCVIQYGVPLRIAAIEG